jgi:hypothetical protein
MIRIRYKDLSAGTHEVTWLHGRAERCPRGVTVYLVPGLTTRQRRAVFRRLRQEASRGFGPPLPQPQLTVALGLDRLRAAAGVAAAVVRLHPAVTLLPGALAASLMALFVLASASPGGLGSGNETLGQSSAAGGLPAPVAARPAERIDQSARAPRDHLDLAGAVASVPALGFTDAWYTCPPAAPALPVPRQRPPARWCRLSGTG